MIIILDVIPNYRDEMFLILQFDIFRVNSRKRVYTFKMYGNKKERLYVSELLDDDPAVSYPSYYVLSGSMLKNEMLHYALIALHSLDLEHYEHPNSYEDIFAMFSGGMYPIYKEMYVVGYFGGKMMYLESAGWKGMPCTEDVFKMENWMVC